MTEARGRMVLADTPGMRTGSEASLIHVIARTSYLAANLSITVDLSEARMIDQKDLSRLRNYPTWTIVFLHGGPPQPTRHICGAVPWWSTTKDVVTVAGPRRFVRRAAGIEGMAAA